MSPADLLATVFAVLAIFSQPTAPPAEFVAGVQWSTPLVVDGFSGLVWICDPSSVGDYDVAHLVELDLVELREAALEPTTEDDVCYAGVDVDKGLVTGP